MIQKNGHTNGHAKMRPPLYLTYFTLEMTNNKPTPPPKSVFKFNYRCVCLCKTQIASKTVQIPQVVSQQGFGETVS